MTWPLTEFTADEDWREKPNDKADSEFEKLQLSCQCGQISVEVLQAHGSSAINCQEIGLTSCTIVRAPLSSRAGMNFTTPLLFAQTYVVSLPPCGV